MKTILQITLLTLLFNINLYASSTCLEKLTNLTHQAHAFEYNNQMKDFEFTVWKYDQQLHQELLNHYNKGEFQQSYKKYGIDFYMSFFHQWIEEHLYSKEPAESEFNFIKELVDLYITYQYDEYADQFQDLHNLEMLKQYSAVLEFIESLGDLEESHFRFITRIFAIIHRNHNNISTIKMLDIFEEKINILQNLKQKQLHDLSYNQLSTLLYDKNFHSKLGISTEEKIQHFYREQVPKGLIKLSKLYSPSIAFNLFRYLDEIDIELSKSLKLFFKRADIGNEFKTRDQLGSALAEQIHTLLWGTKVIHQDYSVLLDLLERFEFLNAKAHSIQLLRELNLIFQDKELEKYFKSKYNENDYPDYRIAIAYFLKQDDETKQRTHSHFTRILRHLNENYIESDLWEIPYQDWEFYIQDITLIDNISYVKKNNTKRKFSVKGPAQMPTLNVNKRHRRFLSEHKENKPEVEKTNTIQLKELEGIDINEILIDPLSIKADQLYFVRAPNDQNSIEFQMNKDVIDELFEKNLLDRTLKNLSNGKKVWNLKRLVSYKDTKVRELVTKVNTDWRVLGCVENGRYTFFMVINHKEVDLEQNRNRRFCD